jgi:hypothetical protein
MFYKIGCGVGITWMEEAFIPRKCGMEETNHCDQISHGKLIFNSLFTCFCSGQFIFVVNEFVFSSDFPFWFSCVCTFLTFKKKSIGTIKSINIFETKLCSTLFVEYYMAVIHFHKTRFLMRRWIFCKKFTLKMTRIFILVIWFVLLMLVFANVCASNVCTWVEVVVIVLI